MLLKSLKITVLFFGKRLDKTVSKWAGIFGGWRQNRKDCGSDDRRQYYPCWRSCVKKKSKLEEKRNSTEVEAFRFKRSLIIYHHLAWIKLAQGISRQPCWDKNLSIFLELYVENPVNMFKTIVTGDEIIVLYYDLLSKKELME